MDIPNATSAFQNTSEGHHRWEYSHHKFTAYARSVSLARSNFQLPTAETDGHSRFAAFKDLGVSNERTNEGGNERRRGAAYLAVRHATNGRNDNISDMRTTESREMDAYAAGRFIATLSMVSNKHREIETRLFLVCVSYSDLSDSM